MEPTLFARMLLAAILGALSACLTALLAHWMGNDITITEGAVLTIPGLITGILL